MSGTFQNDCIGAGPVPIRDHAVATCQPQAGILRPGRSLTHQASGDLDDALQSGTGTALPSRELTARGVDGWSTGPQEAREFTGHVLCAEQSDIKELRNNHGWVIVIYARNVDVRRAHPGLFPEFWGKIAKPGGQAITVLTVHVVPSPEGSKGYRGSIDSG
jgi:hypothetical protein